MGSGLYRGFGFGGVVWWIGVRAGHPVLASGPGISSGHQFRAPGEKQARA